MKLATSYIRALQVFVLSSLVLLGGCSSSLPDTATEALDGRPTTTLDPGAATMVTSLSLIASATGEAVAGYDPIPNGAVLNLVELPEQLSVRANTSPQRVGSVSFDLNGDALRTENYSPYAIAGDAGDSTLFPWTLPALGEHSLSVTPYTGPRRSGTKGTPLTLAFTLVNTTSAKGLEWTSFEPATDTRILYVSNTGNDATAQAYRASAPQIGADPFNPSGAVKPYASFEKALAAARDGYPDWVLLKRGDSWQTRETFSLKSGRSKTQRAVLGAYGPGTALPLIDTGAKGGIDQNSALNHTALVGLDLYASSRDPSSPAFSGTDLSVKADGFFFRPLRGEMTDILIEGCTLRYFSSNVFYFADERKVKDIALRGNTILDNHKNGSEGGHPTGVFMGKVEGVLIEGNVFDHNGWRVQGAPPAQDGSNGKATMYNHNLYISSGNDVNIRNNLFLRGSSMGIKMRADEPGGSKNISIEDNLFVEGEIGVSVGGNTSEANRFENVTVRDNVFLHVGRTQPTGRPLAWNLDILDWSGGVVENNLFAHQQGFDNRLTFAFRVRRVTDVNFRDNVVFELSGDKPLVDLGAARRTTFSGNRIQAPDTAAPLIALADRQGYTLFDNGYYSSLNPNRWFSYGADSVSQTQWQRFSGETDTSLTQLSFPDTSRSLEAYTRSNGAEASFASFLETVRGQSPRTWQSAFEAGQINSYFREGFGME